MKQDSRSLRKVVFPRTAISPGAGCRQALFDCSEAMAMPLAAGEQLGTKGNFRALIGNELVDYTRVDLCFATAFAESPRLPADDQRAIMAGRRMNG